MSTSHNTRRKKKSIYTDSDEIESLGWWFLVSVSILMWFYVSKL